MPKNSDPSTRAVDAANEIADFDLDQLDKGRLTGTVAALQSALHELRSDAEARGDARRQSPRQWLAEVYGQYDRQTHAGRVAAQLAARDPDFDDLRLDDLGKLVQLSAREVKGALDQQFEEGLVDLRPSVRIGAVRIKLLR